MCKQGATRKAYLWNRAYQASFITSLGKFKSARFRVCVEQSGKAHFRSVQLLYISRCGHAEGAAERIIKCKKGADHAIKTNQLGCLAKFILGCARVNSRISFAN